MVQAPGEDIEHLPFDSFHLPATVFMKSVPPRGRDCGQTPVSAPKARNVKAWAIGPGGPVENLLSAEGAKYNCSLHNLSDFERHGRISRLQRF
jgi:hypothetical protein